MPAKGSNMNLLKLSRFQIELITLDSFFVSGASVPVSVRALASYAKGMIKGLKGNSLKRALDVHEFALRPTGVVIPVSDDCPIVLVSACGEQRKSVAGDVNWPIDSIVWDFWRPDLEACKAIVSASEGGLNYEI